MKHLLLTTIAAVVLVGCGESSSELLIQSVREGNVEAVKQHLAAGADVNVKDARGMTPLHLATSNGQKEIVEPLIAAGADVNAKMNNGMTPLDVTSVIPPNSNKTEIIDLLRKHGGTSDWLKGARFDQSRILAAPRSQSREEANRRPLRKHGGKTGEELKAEGWTPKIAK